MKKATPKTTKKKSTTKRTKSSPEQFKLKQFIIDRFIPSPNWPKEMRGAQKLVEKYPEIEFWKTVTLGFDLYSIGYFHSARGKAFLEKRYAEFLKNPLKQEAPLPELSKEKFGEDYKPEKKIKNLREFLLK